MLHSKHAGSRYGRDVLADTLSIADISLPIETNTPVTSTLHLSEDISYSQEGEEAFSGAIEVLSNSFFGSVCYDYHLSELPPTIRGSTERSPY